MYAVVPTEVTGSSVGKKRLKAAALGKAVHLHVMRSPGPAIQAAGRAPRGSGRPRSPSETQACAGGIPEVTRTHSPFDLSDRRHFLAGRPSGLALYL